MGDRCNYFRGIKRPFILFFLLSPFSLSQILESISVVPPQQMPRVIQQTLRRLQEKMYISWYFNSYAYVMLSQRNNLLADSRPSDYGFDNAILIRFISKLIFF